MFLATWVQTAVSVSVQAESCMVSVGIFLTRNIKFHLKGNGI